MSMHVAGFRWCKAQEQSGFTLVEILIALLIGLFLLGGMVTILQNNRRVFTEQGQMTRLQDSQRMAMTIMANVIQSAGYYPDPSVYTLSTALPAAAPFAAGQAIAGTYNSSAPGDTISLRYTTLSAAAGAGDGILNCIGGSNTSGAAVTYVNTFKVSANQLVCTLGGVDYPLVPGLQSMSIFYGVKTDFTSDNFNTDTYLSADQMTADNWNNVMSVTIVLSFNNPLYKAGTTQPQYLTTQRVVGVMSRAGIKI
jgi:type IV pilus assembly protein PilW